VKNTIYRNNVDVAKMKKMFTWC